MDQNIFKNNPAFLSLSPEKLEFLKNFADTQKPTDIKEMVPFLLSSLNTAKRNNIQFSSAESELLIQILKQNMSPEESAKADKIIHLMQERRSGN